jgi:hypothetical protein
VVMTPIGGLLDLGGDTAGPVGDVAEAVGTRDQPGGATDDVYVDRPGSARRGEEG